MDDAAFVHQQIGADGIGQEHQIVQHQMVLIDFRFHQQPQHRHQRQADDRHRQGNDAVDGFVIAHQGRQLFFIPLRQGLIQGVHHNVR